MKTIAISLSFIGAVILFVDWFVTPLPMWMFWLALAMFATNILYFSLKGIKKAAYFQRREWIDDGSE